MKQMSVERRFALKAGLGALLGLVGHAAFAEILEVSGNADNDKAGLARDVLLAAQSRLGVNLIRQLAGHGKQPGTNVIVSPASLASIMSFIDLGANSHLRTAIHRTLGFKSEARSRINAELKGLRTSVKTISENAGDGPLLLANLLVFDPSSKPLQVALLGLSGAGADVLVDHLAKPKTIDRINEWVRQRTRNLIPTIIDEAPETLGLVAVNALYFKDKWKIPFDPARTVTQPFQPVTGSAVDVPMMHSSVRNFAFREDDRFVGAELGYGNENFKLVVVTTKSTAARQAEFAEVADWLAGKGFEEKKGEIALPRLSLSTGEELLSPLDALGLRQARLAPDSLDGFSPESLAITRVVQRLELRVNEEGTEAAAVTAVMTTRSIATEDHVKMIVDKPFVFALRDQTSGLILLMGHIGTPPKQS
jgi:serine protease inhibitor